MRLQSQCLFFDPGTVEEEPSVEFHSLLAQSIEFLQPKSRVQLAWWYPPHSRPTGEGPMAGDETCYTASDKLEKWNSFTRIAGTETFACPDSLPITRIGFVIATMLLSTNAGLSFHLKFFTGYFISPFSM